MMPASSARRSSAVPGCPFGGVPDRVHGQARRCPPQPPVHAPEARSGQRALGGQLRHDLDEALVHREDRDDQEGGEVLAAARAQHPGQARGHEPGQRDAEQHLQQHREQRDEHAERAAGQPDGHPEQADQGGRRPGAGGRGGQQAYRERAGAERVEGQRGGVQGAVEAEDDDRQDQPREPEHAEDHRGQVRRRDAAAQDGQEVEDAARDQRREDRAEDEGDPGPGRRAQRVEQQAQLQLDEEPSHDSTSSSLALEPTRSMNACCRVLPPRTCIGGAGGHDPALVDDGDVVADLLDELHDVAGEQHGRARADEAGQQPADDVGGDRIDALERLVQEQHRGVVDQGAAEHGLLAHAGGVVGDQPLGVLGQVEHVQQLLGPGAGLAGRHAAEPPGVFQQLLTAQPLEQPGLGRHHPDDRLGGGRVGPHVQPVDQDPAAVRPQQAGHHRQGRGLPCPVRPDQPGEGTRPRSPGRCPPPPPSDRNSCAAPSLRSLVRPCLSPSAYPSIMSLSF